MAAKQVERSIDHPKRSDWDRVKEAVMWRATGVVGQSGLS
jgi:predicted NAD-dependent protein-ADP-ribosyltransferase YbiA (DUF1768 family)